MVLSATEKLKILATGKATLKEINELEKQAEGEKPGGEENATNNKTETSVDDVKKETEQDANKESDEHDKSEETDAPIQTSVEDEKDKKIAELENKIKELQQDNVHEDNSGSVIDTDTALLNIFKDFK